MTFWLTRADRLERRRLAEQIAGTGLVIAGALDSTANQNFRKVLEDLRRG